MDRLTIKKKLPPKGIFTSFSKEDMELIGEADEREIYQRLQEYENTEISPEEINNLKSENRFLRGYIDELCHSDSASIECLAIKADNNRLHALLDELEQIINR